MLTLIIYSIFMKKRVISKVWTIALDFKTLIILFMLLSRCFHFSKCSTKRRRLFFVPSAVKETKRIIVSLSSFIMWFDGWPSSFTLLVIPLVSCHVVMFKCWFRPLWHPQVNQQMSGLTLNGAGGQMAFGQPPSAMGGWAAAGSGQTLSTQLWKWTSERVVSPAGWVEVAESAKHILHFSAHHYELTSISIPDQPSEHENSISFFLPLPFSVSLSLYCVSELGVIQDYSLAVSACRMVFDHNFYFPFLEKNYKEITVPTKMISTYQKSCRTSYTSFYCITVSL